MVDMIQCHVLLSDTWFLACCVIYDDDYWCDYGNMMLTQDVPSNLKILSILMRRSGLGTRYWFTYYHYDVDTAS